MPYHEGCHVGVRLWSCEANRWCFVREGRRRERLTCVCCATLEPEPEPGDSSRRRPADVWFRRGSSGSQCAWDFAVTSALRPAMFATTSPGAVLALSATEPRKSNFRSHQRGARRLGLLPVCWSSKPAGAACRALSVQLFRCSGGRLNAPGASALSWSIRAAASLCSIGEAARDPASRTFPEFSAQVRTLLAQAAVALLFSSAWPSLWFCLCRCLVAAFVRVSCCVLSVSGPSVCLFGRPIGLGGPGLVELCCRANSTVMTGLSSSLCVVLRCHQHL